MKRDILILSALCTCCNLFAEEITVKHLRYAGPYEIKGPFIVDSLDVNSKKFTDAELLKTAIPFNNVRESKSGKTKSDTCQKRKVIFGAKTKSDENNKGDTRNGITFIIIL